MNSIRIDTIFKMLDRVVKALVLVWSGLIVVEGNYQLNDFVESSIRKQPGKVRCQTYDRSIHTLIIIGSDCRE